MHQKESIQFDYAIEAYDAFEEIAKKWKQRNLDEGNKEPSSVNCDGYYETCVEDKFAEAYPKEPQIYE